MDENYQTYLNRMMRMTLPDTYQSQAQHIQESPKFAQDAGGSWQAASFPGYTIITPPGSEDGANTAVHAELTQYQRHLTETLGPDLFVPIVPDSFHLTIADIIWAGAFQHASQDPTFEPKLQAGIAHSFEQSAHLHTGQPIPFRPVGLMVMARALAIALAATDETGYNQILELRRSVYQNPDLIAIGIEQQYHFTPHITLGYFGDLSGVDRDSLGSTFDQLNQPWLESTDHTFWVKQAELRKFSDMNTYTRESDWAVFQF